MEALAYMDDHPGGPDAALAEVFSPGSNSIPLKTLVSRASLPPFMAVTSALPRDPFKMIDLGLRTFYQKPLDMEVVCATIKNMIKERTVKSKLQSEYFGFLSDTSIQSGLRNHLEKRLIESGFEAKKVNSIVLPVDEIYTNAVLHGNYGLGARKEAPDEWHESHKSIQSAIENPGDGVSAPYLPLINKKVYVDLKFAWGQALITIRDEGNGFDWKAHFVNGKKPMVPAISGFGISIARRVMEEVLYNDEGNEVTMFAVASHPALQ